MVRLNRTHYSLLQAKFSIFQNCPIKSNSSELRRFRAIRPHSPRIRQNSHILLTFSIMFQVPALAENPGKITANYTNSAQFAHTVRELSKIRTFC